MTCRCSGSNSDDSHSSGRIENMAVAAVWTVLVVCLEARQQGGKVKNYGQNAVQKLVYLKVQL
jgi:hypothetical protein